MSLQTNPVISPPGRKSKKLPSTNPAPAPRRRVSPQLLGWTVMLVSFGLFCLLLYGVVSTVTDYLSHSVQNKTATVEVAQDKDDNVFVLHVGQTKQTVVSDSETLQEGDEVQTDKNSEAVVKFFDDSRADLGAGTRIRIQESRVDIKDFRQSEKRLVIKVFSGSVRFTVAPFVPGKDYNRSTFIAIIPGDNDTSDQAQVLFNDANSRNYVDGVFTLSVNTSDETGVKGLLNNKAARPVMVTNASQSVTLGPGQRVTVAQGVIGAPGLPADNQVNLIENGSFINGIDSWRLQAPSGSTANNIQGLIHFDAEQIADGVQPRARVFRLDPAAKDTPYETSIVQEVNRDVSDYEELWFSIKVKLIDQSLAGGGFQGSEYPVFIKINFVDQNNNTQELFHGFYSKANDTSTQTQDQLGRSSKLPQDEWQEWRINLMNGTNKPVRILKVVVGSAGHLYDSYFTDVSLIAQ
jgi:hypothetical protein